MHGHPLLHSQQLHGSALWPRDNVARVQYTPLSCTCDAHSSGESGSIRVEYCSQSRRRTASPIVPSFPRMTSIILLVDTRRWKCQDTTASQIPTQSRLLCCATLADGWFSKHFAFSSRMAEVSVRLGSQLLPPRQHVPLMTLQHPSLHRLPQLTPMGSSLSSYGSL